LVPAIHSCLNLLLLSGVDCGLVLPEVLASIVGEERVDLSIHSQHSVELLVIRQGALLPLPLDLLEDVVRDLHLRHSELSLVGGHLPLVGLSGVETVHEVKGALSRAVRPLGADVEICFLVAFWEESLIPLPHIGSS